MTGRPKEDKVNLCVYSFVGHLLSTYHVPHTFKLETSSEQIYILVGGDRQKKPSSTYCMSDGDKYYEEK